MNLDETAAQIEAVHRLKYGTPNDAVEGFLAEVKRFEGNRDIVTFSGCLWAALSIAIDNPGVLSYLPVRTRQVVDDALKRLQPAPAAPTKLKYVDCLTCLGKGIKRGNQFPSGDARLLAALKCTDCEGEGQFFVTDKKCTVCNNGVVGNKVKCPFCCGTGFELTMKGSQK